MTATTCERCSNKLNGRQERWCSRRCSKLGLKSAYRKRNLPGIRAYNRDWATPKNGGARPIGDPSKYREHDCLRCGAVEDLQVAHVKPIGAGGHHDHVITLCRSCHHLFDNLLRDFWYTIEA